MFHYFISDLHIGMNHPENWYQSYVHEKPLQNALEYIMNKGQMTEDVVILGDWFDNWTYKETAKLTPPQTLVGACIDNNVNLFTPGNKGNFIDLINCIQGNLHYINGNHDMDISVDMINEKLAPYLSNKKIAGKANPQNNIIYQSSDGKIYAEHGHVHSLLCNFDTHEGNVLQPLPLGYFVSRIVANICSNEIEESHVKSAAELDESGNPVFSTVINHINEIMQRINNPDLGEFSEALITLLTTLDKNKTLEDTQYSMPGQNSPLPAEIAVTYYDWMKKDKVMLTQEFAFVDLMNTLNNCGSALCNQEHPIVIMGHTHVPILFNPKDDPSFIYANTGFMCPDIPGLKGGSKNISFIEVETTASEYIIKVLGVDYKTNEIKTLMTKNKSF